MQSCDIYYACNLQFLNLQSLNEKRDLSLNLFFLWKGRSIVKRNCATTIVINLSRGTPCKLYQETNSNQRRDGAIVRTRRIRLIAVSSRYYLLHELSSVSGEVPSYLKVTSDSRWATNNGQGDNRSRVIRESLDVARCFNILCERYNGA